MNKRTRFQLVAGSALALLLTAAVDSAKGVTISGTIRDLDGNPVAAITVRFVTDPNTTDSVVTDNNGVYTRAVPSNWSGTVTPIDVNFVFDPPSRTYSAITTDQPAQDYTALQGIISIAGYVRTSDGVGIPDVTMSGLPANISTDAQGRYQSFVLRGWTGTVTPTKTNYTFQPPSIPFTSVTENVAADYVGTASQNNGGNNGGSNNGGSNGGDNGGNSGGSNGGGADNSGSNGGTSNGTTDGSTTGDTTSNGTGDTGAQTTPTVTPAACGVGACGAGATSWLPLSILGWCGLKLGTNLRRRG